VIILPEFTKEQQKAIKTDTGHLRIVACAGSGKTETISTRIARLIKNGEKPREIVAFTFTEKAADEMKARIRGILEKECPERADFGDMYIGTIHSFCFEMLKEIDPYYKTFEVLNEAQRVALVAKRKNLERLQIYAMRPLFANGNRAGVYQTINMFLYSVDLIMNEYIDIEKVTNERFKHAYKEYMNILDEKGTKYLDFSSMMYKLVKLLENDASKLAELNRRIKHLTVDEYQDVNTLQEKLIEFISIGAKSVCVVGDDDQCIYNWRGSHVRNIIEFKKKYEKKDYKVLDIPLEQNFRSTEAVIHTAREFIKKNSYRIDMKSMKSSDGMGKRYEEGDIIHYHFDEEEQEFDFIVQQIKSLVNTDYTDKHGQKFSLSYPDFAVLVRTNEDAAKVIHKFELSEIPCIAYSGSTVFDRPEIQLAMNCIAYIFDCNGFNMQSVPTFTQLQLDYKGVFKTKTYPKANSDEFIRKIDKIKTEINIIFRKSPNDYLKGLGFQEIYHKILGAMGSEIFSFGEVYSYNMAVLSQAISDYESVWIRLRASEIEGFFYFVYAYAQNHYAEIQHSDPTLINAVQVLTIHKAKGLQFPVVFIPCLIEKRPPWPVTSFVDTNLYDVNRYRGSIEDDRRLYYTAITRSEKYLFLTGSIERDGRTKRYKPHQFVQEFNKKYFSSSIKPIKRKISGLPPRVIHQKGIFPTSFSEISCYDRCPHDFHLRHIYGFNAGVPAPFGYGTNIHNILNLIHKNYIKEKKIPSEAEIERMFERMFTLRYATEKISEPMKKTGIQIVKNYVKLHKNDFNTILETEKRFEFVIDSALISGQIDLLKRVDDNGVVTGVEIIDFKTENDGEYRRDFEKQLRLYAVACLTSLGINPKKAIVHHLDKSGVSKKDDVDISKKKLDETKDDIKLSATSILKQKFNPKPSKVCQVCDWRKICHAKKK
jgi:DNA helicase-2/ATP-dependent DNA helicase PcrA